MVAFFITVLIVSIISQSHPSLFDSPCSTSSPDTVHILLHIPREVIVENMRDVMNI